MPQKTLHFSIHGEFITNLAREKLYENNDLPGAVDFLLSCLESDQLSLGDRLLLAVQILNGEKKITGTYPENDADLYGVQDDTPEKTTKTIQLWCKKREQEIENLKKQNRQLTEKLICVGENLTEYDCRKINRAWNRDYGESGCIFQCDDSDPEWQSDKPDLVQEFIERMQSDREDDYGWLEPNGTYHPVPWGDHYHFAQQWLKDHDPGFDLLKKEYRDPGETLRMRGWVLLHSPAQGIARPTVAETHVLTKKQRNFLFDYYIKRKRNDLACRYVEQDDD